MNRPNRVRILNLDYAIQWVEAPQARTMEHSGEIFYPEQVIAINATRSLQCQADTLLHEIIHGLYYAAGFGEDESGCEEEDIVRLISTGLCTVWLHNPDVMSWIHLAIQTKPHQVTLAQIMAAGPPKLS